MKTSTFTPFDNYIQPRVTPVEVMLNHASSKKSLMQNFGPTCNKVGTQLLVDLQIQLFHSVHKLQVHAQCKCPHGWKTGGEGGGDGGGVNEN